MWIFMGDNINVNVFSSCLNRRFVKYIGEILPIFFFKLWTTNSVGTHNHNV